jgi:hypothetical protein
MICLYRRPDKIVVRVTSGADRGVVQSYKPEDILWDKRAGDLAEGVYDAQGNFLGSFVDYWAGEPLPKQRSGWWSKRLLGEK